MNAGPSSLFRAFISALNRPGGAGDPGVRMRGRGDEETVGTGDVRGGDVASCSESDKGESGELVDAGDEGRVEGAEGAAEEE